MSDYWGSDRERTSGQDVPETWQPGPSLVGEHQCPACGLEVDEAMTMCWRCQEDDDVHAV